VKASVDGLDQVLAEVIPNMEAGDEVVIHDPECDVGDGDPEGCSCEVIRVRGPSGKA
jgi:hypothetical protein